MDNIPSLTEPGTKSFLNHMLKQCHNVKSKYYNTNYYENLSFEPVFNELFIFGAYNKVLRKGK